MVNMNLIKQKLKSMWKIISLGFKNMNFGEVLVIFTVPFLGLILVEFYYPNLPIKDEIIFAYDVSQFSEKGLEYISHMKSGQGPLFFYLLGLFGNCFSVTNILPFRLINIFIAGLIAAISIKLVDENKLPIFVTFTMLINPYFWGLTSVLIYSDNSVIFLLLLSLHAYLKNLKFVSIMFLTAAILIRQTSILGVLPFVVLEMFIFKPYKKDNIFLFGIPFLALGILIYFFWGGNLMSPNVSKAYGFYKTVGGFDFQLIPTLKSILYQLSLIGFLSIFFLNFSFNRKKLLSMLLLIITCIIVEPIHINQRYHHLLPVLLDGGYFDRFLQLFTPLSYIVMGWIINSLFWTVWEGRRNIFNDKLNAFIFIFIICNLGFYSISTFWDKYYIIMGLLAPILLVKIKSDPFVKQDDVKNLLTKSAPLS
jgi:hypothetical protein